jgi:hypothetical protein
LYILYRLNNFYNIFNICNLAKCVLSFILFNKFYMCVNMYYKLIFINKFIRHNRVNDSCCNIKYLYITILIFLIMFYLSLITFFFHLFTESSVVYLLVYMNEFFNLHLRFFYVKNRVEKFNIKFIWSCIGVFNLIIILMISLIFPIMFLFIVDYFFVFHLFTQ